VKVVWPGVCVCVCSCICVCACLCVCEKERVSELVVKVVWLVREREGVCQSERACVSDCEKERVWVWDLAVTMWGLV